MKIRESSLGYWSSTRTFLWVASGLALGVGNLVRLPLLMAEFGGTAFLVIYVLCLLLLSWPLIVAEWVLGRWMRTDVVSGHARLTETAENSRLWSIAGVIGLAAAVMLLSYYSVVAGWGVGYTFRAAAGALSSDPKGASETFLSLATDPERSLAWHTLFMAMVCIIVSQGFRNGIERAAGYLLPAAFVLLLILAVAAMHIGNTAEAAARLFAMNWSQLGWRGVFEAMQQAFFTMGIGFAAMTTLGTCLPAHFPTARAALAVVVLDTLFSVLAGVIVFSLTTSAGLPPMSALTLLFVGLPQALPADLAGLMFGTAFYLLLILTTMSAATVLLEPLTRLLMDRYRLTRVFAATTAAILVWYLGLGSLLSFSQLSGLRVLGQNFFDWMQLLSTSLFAPIYALVVSTQVSQLMPREFSKVAWGTGTINLYRPWLYLLRYPVRIALLGLMLYSLGAIDWMVSLWQTS